VYNLGGGGRGHTLQPFALEEFVHFDVIVMRNGVLGGGSDMHCRWDKEDSRLRGVHEPIPLPEKE
jgi:hypothetical protein